MVSFKVAHNTRTHSIHFKSVNNVIIIVCEIIIFTCKCAKNGHIHEYTLPLFKSVAFLNFIFVFMFMAFVTSEATAKF